MKISVIIPTFNREKELKRAIKSVLRQTYKVKEILICDDGSTDNSRLSIQQFPVKWIPGKHSGLPAVPRNRGIKKASGDWIAFLDSDDEWLPAKLEAQVASLKKNKLLACCTNAYRVRPKHNKEILIKHESSKLSLTNMLLENKIVASSVLVNKDLLKDGFPKDPKLKALEDYALWLKILLKTNFCFVPKPLVNYFDNPSGSIRKDSLSVGHQRFLIWKHIINENFTHR